jgi:hypothetical protein
MRQSATARTAHVRFTSRVRKNACTLSAAVRSAIEFTLCIGVPIVTGIVGVFGKWTQEEGWCSLSEIPELFVYWIPLGASLLWNIVFSILIIRRIKQMTHLLKDAVGGFMYQVCVRLYLHAQSSTRMRALCMRFARWNRTI